jgi:hypothetical protein
MLRLKSKPVAILALGVLTMVAVGCQKPAASSAAKSSEAASEYLLKTEPAGAQEIIAVRANAKNDEEVTLVGRIGGDTNPWVEGRAAFSLVDNSLKSCSDIPGDACEKPWDYCCESGETLAASRVLVKIVDKQGKLVATDARKLLGVKELQTLVVHGKAQRDDKGNLTVLATGVFVKP